MLHYTSAQARQHIARKPCASATATHVLRASHAFSSAAREPRARRRCNLACTCATLSCSLRIISSLIACLVRIPCKRDPTSGPGWPGFRQPCFTVYLAFPAVKRLETSAQYAVMWALSHPFIALHQRPRASTCSPQTMCKRDSNTFCVPRMRLQVPYVKLLPSGAATSHGHV